MKTNTLSILSHKFLHIAGFALLCVAGSFVLGVQTAGEVHPFTTSQPGEITANGIPLSTIVASGDIDGSGELDLQDVIGILEIVQGYEAPSPLQLKADPNGDNRLTVEDALRVLRTLAVR